MSTSSRSRVASDLTVHVGFGPAEMTELRYYAAECSVAVTTLIKAIVRERLTRAQRQGVLRLEFPDLEVTAYGR